VKLSHFNFSLRKKNEPKPDIANKPPLPRHLTTGYRLGATITAATYRTNTVVPFSDCR
jgi:hypothetical protein